MPTPDWATEVLQQIAALSAKHDALQDTCDDLRMSLSKLNKLLTGNGEPERGIVLKLDRLEQESKRRQTWVKAAIASSVSCVIGLIGYAIKHGF